MTSIQLNQALLLTTKLSYFFYYFIVFVCNLVPSEISIRWVVCSILLNQLTIPLVHHALINNIMFIGNLWPCPTIVVKNVSLQVPLMSQLLKLFYLRHKCFLVNHCPIWLLLISSILCSWNNLISMSFQYTVNYYDSSYIHMWAHGVWGSC